MALPAQTDVPDKEWALVPSFSVDENSISATALADTGLRQTPISGCSPGCRNDGQSLSVDGIDCQQLDPQLLQIIERWPLLTLPIKTALITTIDVAISAALRGSEADAI